YLEQLETLEVKANLVTPILNEGKLFGLLVAHQCSQPRNWQDYEIRWVTQIATQVGFALDNATLLKKLKNDGLPTQLLNNFSLSLSERVNRSQLLKIAVEQARKIIKLDRVIVYQFDDRLYGNIVAESVVPGYPRALNSQIKDPCFAREYGEKYRQGRIKAIADIDRANLTSCHLEQLESLAVRASIIVPILQDEQLFGLLIGHQCQQPRLWEQSEIDLFAQLALQLGLALDRVNLKEALQRNKFNSRETIPKSNKTPIENEVLAAQKAIAEVTEKVEMLNQSHQNLHQTIDLIDDLKENFHPPRTLAQLPMRDIIIEPNEITLNSINNYNSELDLVTGQLVKQDESEPSLLLMNQFVREITNLSAQISQQSLFVTKSFQKLAAFAKQLSERKEF
ncbi:MAG: GAF domain-containing protein, partial [Pleurocapsa sp.]